MQFRNIICWGMSLLVFSSLATATATAIEDTASAAVTNHSQPSASTLTQVTKPAQPNIVFIFADDLGYGDIGQYGSSTIRTPNIDRMAKEGVKFNEFYSASPVCTPSRAGLLTGRYPIRQGIHDVFYPESFQGMDPEEVTIAEVLRQAGYATGLVGKWHLGHHEKYMPWNQGFDEFFGLPYSNDMGGLYYFRNKDILFDEVDQRFLTKTYTEQALEFIDKHQQQPFFLYLSHNMPHVPLYASPQFEGQSKGGLYGDVVEELDWSVGQILDRLDQLNLADNTLVIFTSDNGPWKVMGKAGGSAGELREGKQFTFEGGMRVPAVAYWPGTIAAGTEPAGIATMMDWLPTFSRLAGATLPTDRVIDGKDITGLLTAAGSRENQQLFYYMSGELRAYRNGDWKIKLPYKSPLGFLSWIHSGFVSSHDLLLFNLKLDPQESTNLAASNPDQVASMQQEIEQFRLSLGDLPPAMKTGKNMDYGPYIDLAVGLLGKILGLLLVFLIVSYFVIRTIVTMIRSKSQ